MKDATAQPWPGQRQQDSGPRRNPVSGWLAVCIALSAGVGFFSADLGKIFESSSFGRRTTAIAVRFANDIQQRVASSTTPTPKVVKSERTVLVASSLRAAPIDFEICGPGKRLNCVVDGDTFWYDGEKIRIETIDAPEILGRCSQEKKLAVKATQRLAQILSRNSFTIERSGVDRHGRTLASVSGSSGEAGAILVREGLARPWRGHKEVWCRS
jgi:micrococcal nuclease